MELAKWKMIRPEYNAFQFSITISHASINLSFKNLDLCLDIEPHNFVKRQAPILSINNVRKTEDMIAD